MAEADAFIFAALQQSGCLEASASDADSSWTAGDLVSDAFVAIVYRCLARIQEADDLADLALPDAAPSGSMGVAARHRMGSKLANVLKELGYAGDCGYNHFLYPSEKETRNILSWLAGKLPRSRLEDGFEEDVQVESATSGDATTAGAIGEGSLLSNGGLASIFSAWKHEKTLYVLPNREMNGLRGFQRLPLRTAAVSLPWGKRKDQSVDSALFEGFPSDAIKPTSLLEKLAAAKRGATALLQEDEFDNVIKARRVGDERQPREDPEEAAATSFLAPKAGEAEDDDFASINPQSFLLSALPDVPLSLNTSASPDQVVADAVADGATIAEPTESSSLEAEKSRQEHPSEEEGELVLEQVQQQVDETQRRLAAMRKVLTRDHAALQQIQQRGLETQAAGQEIQRQLATQKQLVEMLPQAQENMAKLEAICSTNAEKKEEIARQMESTRAPLLEEYNALEARKSNRKTRGRQLIREMKTFRQEMHEMTGVIHTKREDVRLLEKVEARQLAKRKEKAGAEGKPMRRSMYTNRIMDIIKQVHKQKQDITKVLEDIKALQKQLNSASEKLKRTEAVAEDKLYSAASSRKSSSTSGGKADAYVECYRKFAQVRELFEELILVVGDVGKKENASRDLQNWISQLEARDSSRHVDRVLADLESVRLENSSLQNELYARSA